MISHEKSYVGLTGNTFKDRYNSHQYSFRHKSCRKSTELSKYIWDLKDKGINCEIQWEIMRQSNIKMRESGQCNLCLDEKIEILKLKGSGVGTFGDPPNLTLTHLTRRLTLILFRLGLKELVMGGYCVQKQPRGSRLSLPG